MMWVALAGGILLIVCLARGFAAASREADRPTFVFESPPWPRTLAPVAVVLDRWREDGRLSHEEHHRLFSLLREDATKEVPRP
ncbi:MAG: hypothetical protein IPN90_07440 [Elusimicrobia bacterium]|nr:hypothetical protein [Elusimicrobiota bacterium]